jgi:hypothetical protein
MSLIVCDRLMVGLGVADGLICGVFSGEGLGEGLFETVLECRRGGVAAVFIICGLMAPLIGVSCCSRGKTG